MKTKHKDTSAFEARDENWTCEVEAHWGAERRKAEEILSDVLDLVKKEVSAGRNTFARGLEKMG